MFEVTSLNTVNPVTFFFLTLVRRHKTQCKERRKKMPNSFMKDIFTGMISRTKTEDLLKAKKIFFPGEERLSS